MKWTKGMLATYTKKVAKVKTSSKRTLTEEDKDPKRSVYKFLLKSWKVLNPNIPLSPNWHLELLSEYLEAIYYGEIKKLLINIAPRSLKSFTTSIAFPAWCWSKSPYWRFLCLSYSSQLANDHSQIRRDLIRTQWYKNLNPNLSLKLDKDRISEYGNSAQGEMIARGMDGSVTGVGADCLIFDDPNNPKPGAESLIQLEATNKKFDDYSIGRRNNPKESRVIVIQQRVGVRDVTGHILADLGGYEHIKIPTKAPVQILVEFPRNRDREIVREAGSFVHPERFGEEEDNEALRTLGAQMYAARHDQEPYAIGGGIFTWDKTYFSEPPTQFHLAISVDASFGSINDTASYVVVQCWLVWRPYFWLWDQKRGRWTFPDTLSELDKAIAQWQKELGKPVSTKLIEEKANGKAIIQKMREKYTGIIPVIPKESKKARAEAIAPTYRSGNVILRKAAGYLEEYKKELEAFPASPNDDQVDASTQLIKHFLDQWAIIDQEAEEIGTIRFS
ncbi:MAG: phage terminase large subunit [Symploca sp. SIO2G7]|nr:phage terminase large subunit [Symploca sp. SIO2G7]